MKAWRKHLSLIPLALIIFVLIRYLSANFSSFISHYDGGYWWNRYENSQYTQGEHSGYILSDAEFNAIKADRLVRFQADPSSFPAGHPPLANYFIGLSLLLFGNPNIFSFLSGLICIGLFYLIGRYLLKSTFWSLVVTLAFVSEPLFLTQLNDSLLDVYQLMFALTGILFYFKWLLQGQSLKWIILSQLSLGLMLSTKFFLGNLPLVMALYFATVLTGNFKRFKLHTLSLLFVFIGFAAGQLTYFFYHPSLIDFLKYQRYILSWWAGSPQVPPFQGWDLIFNNRWHTWWGKMDILSAPEWRLTWPVLTILSLLSLPLILVRKIQASRLFIPFLALYLWILGSLFIFSFSALYPRHLLLIFPALYLLSATTLLAYRDGP